MCVSVSSSGRKGVAGVGGAVELPALLGGGMRLETLSLTIGARMEQSPHSEQFAAISNALTRLSDMQYYDTEAMTSQNCSA